VKSFSTFKSIKFSVILIAFFLGLFLLIGEIHMRIYFEDDYYLNKSIYDKKIGWVSKADYIKRYPMSDLGNPDQEYMVNFKTFDHGFRSWGNVESQKAKVLFLGDSFVHAIQVNNQQTFYNILKDTLDIEVFAYGSSGYGTLQEKMILERYIDVINPDLIVLQACTNDFVDNHLALELNSNYKVGIERPYYNLQNEITYGSTKSEWQLILEKSRFLRLIRQKFMMTFYPPKGQSAQDLIALKGINYKPYKAACGITNLLVSEMKILVGEIPILAFAADAKEPQMTDLNTIFKTNHIPFTCEPGLGIQRCTALGLSVLNKDGFHWNSKGHQKVAELLYDDIFAVIHDASIVNN
jgi:lysophospholipase L1-like esterase